MFSVRAHDNHHQHQKKIFHWVCCKFDLILKGEREGAVCSGQDWLWGLMPFPSIYVTKSKKKGRERERNITWRCQGQSEDVCSYLWHCQINKIVIIKLAVRSKNLTVATTPCCYNVGRCPFWPLPGHFLAGTISLRCKTELSAKVNLCCTWRFISINHQHEEGSWPWMASSPRFLLTSKNHLDT